MTKLSDSPNSKGEANNTVKLLEAIKDIADNIREECDKKY